MKGLWSKYKELIRYCFWGVITTVVNYGVYFVCTQALQINYLLSNVLSWVVAVIVAFVVNKVFVFSSRSWQWSILFGELWKFVSARIFSGVLETGILYVFVDLLHIPDGIIKILAGVVVVLTNYVISKLFIFKKDKKEE